METCFITGANRGIGLGLAQRALSSGYRVFAGCRHPEAERDLWELESDYKGRFILVPCDVTTVTGQDFREYLGDDAVVDVLINNAGVFLDQSAQIDQLDPNRIGQSFAVNTIGPLRMIQALLPHLSQSKSPKIINITSKMGSISDNTSGGSYGYRMAKAALNMLTKGLSIDLPNITTVAIHPGWVKTRMGGDQAPLDTQTSVDGIWDTLTSLSLADSGRFVDYKGGEIPW